MNKEDYVSLQVAKLLKEKGYNEYCGAYYHCNYDDMTEEECFEVAPDYDFRNSSNIYRIAAPTLYEAQQWLWNVYKLLVTAFLDEPFSEPYEFLWTIQDSKNDIDNYGNKISINVYRSYQEAMDAGIFEALKMI